MNRYFIGIFLLLGILFSVLFVYNKTEFLQSPELQMTVVSNFEELGIPKKYTADDININPPLTINNIPRETKTLAIIMEDVDTPQDHWVHWIVLIPVDNTNNIVIEENQLPDGSIIGMNSWKEKKYLGPDPKIGTGTHRYFFTVYALKKTFDPYQTYEKHTLESEMKGFIIQKAEILGVYKRL